MRKRTGHLRGTRICSHSLSCLPYSYPSHFSGIAQAIVFAFMLLGVSQVYATCPANMVAYWKGDGNALDSSGNGNTGQLINGLAFASGKVNQAFNFNAQGDYNNPNYFSDGTMLNPGANTNREFTLEAWVYPRANLGRFFDNGGYHHQSGTYTFGLRSNGTLIFVISDGNEPSWPGIRSSNSVLPLNQWSHVAATAKQIDSNYEMRVYINGALDTAINITRFPYSGGQPLTLGIVPRFDGPSQDRLDGLMDEAAIYNRALTPSEIQQHYFGGIGIDYCQAGAPPAQQCPTDMVAYWKGDGNANDALGRNNGTYPAGTYATGQVGQAFSFDGNNNYVSTTFVPDTLIGDHHPFTLMAWHYPTGTNYNNRYIFGGEQSESSTRFFVYQSTDGWKFTWGYGNQYIEPVGTAAVLNAWNQIAFVYDGSYIKLYHNGTEVYSAAYTGDADLPNTGMPIGCVSRAGSCLPAYYKGLIDEVAIFNSSLSATEIQSYYQNGLEGLGYCERAGAPPEPPTCGQEHTEGMISYWRGNGNADDVVGANGGTLFNGASANAQGKVGQAFSFDGTNDYINLPSNSLAWENTKPMTIEAWINLNSPNPWVTILSRLSMNSPWYGYSLMILSDDVGQGSETMFAFGGGQYNAAYARITGGINSLVGTWHHVAATYDGSGSMYGVRLYQDGQLLENLYTNPPATTGAAMESSAVPNIGAREGQIWFFNGAIDEIAIYDHVLSQSDIQTHIALSNAGEPYCNVSAPPPNTIYNTTGGTVENEGITVTVPQGALGTTELLVTIIPSEHSFAPVAGYEIISQPLDIGPQCTDVDNEADCQSTNGCMWLPEARCDSIPFLSPVTITMPGDCSGVYGDLTSQGIFKFNVVSGSWEPVSTCTDLMDMGGGVFSCTDPDSPVNRVATWDTGACTMSVQTYHFSTYAVIKQTQAGACPDGMISYYHLDDSANAGKDSVDANDGTNYGATYAASGKVSGAYSFNGVDNQIVISPSSNLNNLNAVTLETWIKTSSSAAGMIIAKHDGSGATGSFYLQATGSTIRFMIINSSGKGTGRLDIDTPAFAYNDGNWHHVVATYNSPQMLIYIDGVLKKSAVQTGSILNSDAYLRIGSYGSEAWGGGGGGGSYFNGLIDEAAVYNRALTQDEITAHYNNGTGKDLCAAPPAGGCPDGMGNKRPVTITSASALTDYQVSMTVDTASIISTGKMKSDCSDVRFYSGSTKLSYWLESGCNSASTKFWVKTSLTAGSNTVYMYHGDPSASSESNGDATFIFFDDFEGNLNLSKWNIIPGRGIVETSTAQAKIGTHSLKIASTPASDDADVWHDFSPTLNNIVFEYWFWDNTADTVVNEYFAQLYQGNNAIHNGVSTNDAGQNIAYHDGSWHNSGIPRVNGWSKLVFKIHDGIDFTFNGQAVYTNNQNQVTNSLSKLNMDDNHNWADTFYVDGMLIHKYTASEPSVTLGSEEMCEAGAPPIVCGNGAAEAGEECDMGDLNGQDCTTRGYFQGSLSCTDSCTFDVSGCQCQLPIPPCSRYLGVCAGLEKQCMNGEWMDCTEADYQSHSSLYSTNENTVDNCWDGEDNDCSGLADKDELGCQPGGIPLQTCLVKDMVDLNDDKVVDSFDALIVLRAMIGYPNKMIEPRNCQAINIRAA